MGWMEEWRDDPARHPMIDWYFGPGNISFMGTFEISVYAPISLDVTVTPATEPVVQQPLTITPIPPEAVSYFCGSSPGDNVLNWAVEGGIKGLVAGGGHWVCGRPDRCVLGSHE